MHLTLSRLRIALLLDDTQLKNRNVAAVKKFKTKLGNSQSLESQSGLHSAIRNRLTTHSPSPPPRTYGNNIRGCWQEEEFRG